MGTLDAKPLILTVLPFLWVAAGAGMTGEAGCAISNLLRPTLRDFAQQWASEPRISAACLLRSY